MICISLHVLFTFSFSFSCSFLHLALSLNVIGKYKHMNQKSFGQSIALTNQRKALLLLVGCKLWILLQSPFWVIVLKCLKLKTFLLSRRGHLFDYTSAVIIYEMCVQEPTATVSPFQIFFLRIVLICRYYLL